MLLQKLVISFGPRLRCDFPKGSFAPRTFCTVYLIFKTRKLKDRDLL